MEKRLKKLTVSQIRKVYCKMMKTKQTKLKKKDIISKLLKPLKRKYRVMALWKRKEKGEKDEDEDEDKEGERIPENIVRYFDQFLTSGDRGIQMSLNKGVSNPLKNLSHTDPNQYVLIESRMKHLEDAQRTLNKFDKYNMKAIEKKYGLYSNQLSTPRLFIVALVINKKLFEKKNRTVLENIFGVMSINSKRNAGYKYSIHDIFAEAILMLSDRQRFERTGFKILDFIKILLNRVDVNKQIDNEVGDYTTSLKLASEKGYLDLVKILLEHGADVNSTTGDYDYTALMYASKYEHIKIVQILLKHGADVNIQNRNGFTALIYASERGYSKIVGMLLEHGADINQLSNFGENALMIAINQKYVSLDDITKTVKILLDYKVNVNIKNKKDGSTALMSALKLDYSKIVEMLLEHGADVNEKDNNGTTALMLSVNDVMIWRETVKMLLEHGADVNEKDNNGYTALMLSVNDDNVKTVKMLLEHGADVDIQNVNGQTALIYAADSDGESSEKIVGMLLDHGADIDIKNNHNKKAIDFTYNARNDGKKMLILAKMH